jgi:hypothetical protein
MVVCERRCALPDRPDLGIRLLPRVFDVKAHVGPRVKDARLGKPDIDELRHTLPCEAVFLAAPPPTAFSLLEWSQIADQSEDMTPIWNTGESWFRNLLETHSRTPLLALIPSVYSGTTWISAAATILDAASFALSSQKVKGLESARLCHAAGVDALRHIARQLPGAMNGDTVASGGTDDLVAAFDAQYEKLVAAGLSMKPDRDECRRDFLTRRLSYEVSCAASRWRR